MSNDWKKEWKGADVHKRVNIVLMGVLAAGLWVHVVLIALGVEY
ncbi:hypothetical protein MHB71_05030 [Paenibacillus sp. FSL H7-0940]